MKEEKKSEFATIHRFSTLDEAVIAKSMLESMGVRCVIFDENISHIGCGGMFGSFSDRVRLVVRSEDVELAMKILKADFDPHDLPAE